ncbi:hypothetical protein HW452_05155 [Halomonas aquamarina]|uniref:Uncharacterized protein n=1 Tax=Vreelandella aquamarina TaxID=77097 RepID=A0ACC5VTQ5_9GAMM|nr:hypothetical protein [Halomonas aquamarina]MBZ5486909.1 hypothetical protein [Halomonas aquamarina]
MANHTKWGKNVIFCGPAQMLEQPLRKESPVASSPLPGTIVHLDANGKFAAGPGDVSYVLDKDHLGQEFIDTAYTADDTATAFYCGPGLILNVLTDGEQDIVEDAPLFATAGGTLTATDPADGSTAIGHAAETLTTGTGSELVAVKFI